jgi:peptidoglycan hydrolase CwlO-like protein
LDELTNESNGLREAKLNNGKEITEYRINYQHLENDLQHKCKTIEDKQKIIESQAAQIKQIEGELKQ